MNYYIIKESGEYKIIKVADGQEESFKKEHGSKVIAWAGSLSAVLSAFGQLLE